LKKHGFILKYSYITFNKLKKWLASGAEQIV